jgi:hypothetical protein
VHRVAWKEWIGPIPDGLCVLHRCDNPPCFNPDHLFLGTKTDNHEDMVRKGRRNVARGEQHARTHLTEADVIAIRDDHRSNCAIGRAYNIDEGAIRAIKARRTWRHVPG